MAWRRGGGYKAPPGWKRTRQRVFERDNFTCRKCGAYVGLSGICDHIRARSQGGSDDMRNLQCLCRQCSKIKSLGEAAHGRRKAQEAQTPGRAEMGRLVERIARKAR